MKSKRNHIKSMKKSKTNHIKSMKKSKKKYMKSKKGGFFNFWSNKPKVTPSECDPNNLSMIKDAKSMHANYQTCCPKNWMGRKNSSSYCKQLDLNFKAVLKGANDNAGNYASDEEVSKNPAFFNQIPELKQQPALNQQGLNPNINKYEV